MIKLIANNNLWSPQHSQGVNKLLPPIYLRKGSCVAILHIPTICGKCKTQKGLFASHAKFYYHLHNSSNNNKSLLLCTHMPNNRHKSFIHVIKDVYVVLV